MEGYYNNYSEYITKLKSEKSKRNFEEHSEIETKKEIGIEKHGGLYDKASIKVSSNEIVSEKDMVSAEYTQISAEKGSVKFVDSEFGDKSRHNFDIQAIAGEKVNYIVTLKDSNEDRLSKDSFLIVNEYARPDKISENINGELTLTDKNGLMISEIYLNPEKTGNSVYSDTVGLGKEAINVSEQYAFGSKDENALTDNVGIAVKDENALTDNVGIAVKDENATVVESSLPNKEFKSIIDSIKAERKHEREFAPSSFNEKNESNLSNRTKSGRKVEVSDLNRISIHRLVQGPDWSNIFNSKVSNTLIAGFGNGKQADAALFNIINDINDLKDDIDDNRYYPKGSIGQIGGSIMDSISSIINVAANKNNWSSPLSAIAGTASITADVLSIFGGSKENGPSQNLSYLYTTEDGEVYDKNEFRGDLLLKQEYLPSKYGANKRSNNENDEERAYENKAPVAAGDPEALNGKAKADEDQELKEIDKVVTYDKESDLSKLFTGKSNGALNGKANEGQDLDTIDKVVTYDKEGDLSKLFSGKSNKSNPKSEKAEDSLSKLKPFSYTKADGSEGTRDGSRWFDAIGAAGYIYVVPPFFGINNNYKQLMKIPLQNNVKFGSLSRAASYNTIQFFQRIGDVRQYVRTGSYDALRVSTEYFVDGKNDQSDYTMKRLQQIELMYKSLVLPARENLAENSDAGSYYTRPPVINIVVGKDIQPARLVQGDPSLISNTFNTNNYYKNLFTDYYINGTDKELRYKNYVVTNVTIEKDQQKYAYFTASGNVYDVMGFEVSLDLLEIDSNYLNSVPSYTDYVNLVGEVEINPEE